MAYSSSASGTTVNPTMLGIYNDLLARNQSNYNNILSGYAQGQQKLSQQLPGIYNSYGDIQKNVMNTLGLGGGGWGVATPAAQAIQRSFQQAMGSNAQRMISAGLGNTSVLSNLQTGAALQAGQAYGGLGAQLAKMAADYQAQLGQAQAAARMQGAGLQAGMTDRYLGNLAGHRFANTAGQLLSPYSSSYSYNPESSGGGGGYGVSGGVRGSASPGGAASAVNATGAIPFGTAGMGDSYGYAGGYANQGYYNPYGGGGGGGGGGGFESRSLWDLADMSQGDINAMGTGIWDYADLGS